MRRRDLKNPQTAMAGHRYKLGSDFLFKESDKPYERVLRFIGAAFVVAVVVALVVYGIFALTINTDTEGRLKRENKMYEKLYSQLSANEELLEDAISGLEIKDAEIYTDVFRSPAPSVDPIESLIMEDGESQKNESLIAYAAVKSDSMYVRMHEVEANLLSALSLVADETVVKPPMRLPIDGISFTQIGASLGDRTNPVLRARVRHDGMDIIASTGTPVLAAGDGKVTVVDKNDSGFGNMVSISHAGGYVTRYAHLSTVSVKREQSVHAGQKIGAVGMSGKSFAPHLHYEVLLNGVYLDPVNYIHASVDPREYSNMFYMASNTEQSMD